MNRPTTDLWEKTFRQDMRDWVKWHAERTEIDNKKDFVRWFMQYSQGKMNPQTVMEAWDDKEHKKMLDTMNAFINHVHSPFYEELLREQDVNPE